MAQTSAGPPAAAPRARPFEDRAGFLAVRLGDVVIREATAALAPLGLKPRDYNVMHCILAEDRPSQQDLSRRLGLYAPGLVGLLDGLQTKSLVTRQRSGHDRRRHILQLTAQGRALLDQADAAVRTVEERLFGALSDEERGTFDALIRRALLAGEECALQAGRGA